MNFMIKLVFITFLINSINSNKLSINELTYLQTGELMKQNNNVVKIGNVGLNFSKLDYNTTKIVSLNDGRIAIAYKIGAYEFGVKFFNKNGGLISSFNNISNFADMKAYNNELIYYDGTFVYKINPDVQSLEKIFVAPAGDGKLAILGDSIAIANHNGVMVYNMIKKNFEMTNYTHSMKYSIGMTEDTVFATTSSGEIISYDRKTKQAKSINSINSYSVYGIACLNNNSFAVTSAQGQLYIFNAKTFSQTAGPFNIRFNSFPIEIKKISENEIAVLYSDGQLVVSSTTSRSNYSLIKFSNGEEIISIDVIDKDNLIALDSNGNLLVIS